MTAIMMAAQGAAAVTLSALDTTVTVGESSWFVDGTDGEFFAWGFNDVINDPNGLETVGSIGDTTYTDGTLTTRTVSFIYYTEDTSGLAVPNEDSIFFGLVDTGIADSDTTFREIEYNGQTYVRADADAQGDFGGVVTYWHWQNVNPNGPTSGVRDFKVIL